MPRASARLRLALVALVFVAPHGAWAPGCRDGRAGNRGARSSPPARADSNARVNSNSQANSNAERDVMGRELKIRHGQEVEAGGGSGLRVRFASVADDSRCPVGVNCIWEGDAEVRLAVRAGGGREAEVTLHTSDRFGREARHVGHVFKLVALAPHPQAETKINPADYVLTLTVTKE